jgi:hypothetical protein
MIFFPAPQVSFSSEGQETVQHTECMRNPRARSTRQVQQDTRNGSIIIHLSLYETPERIQLQPCYPASLAKAFLQSEFVHSKAIQNKLSAVPVMQEQSQLRRTPSACFHGK